LEMYPRAKIVKVDPSLFESRDCAIERTLKSHEAGGWHLWKVVSSFYHPGTILIFRRWADSPCRCKKVGEKSYTLMLLLFITFLVLISEYLFPLVQFIQYPRSCGLISSFVLTAVGCIHWISRAAAFRQPHRVYLFGGTLLGVSGIVFCFLFTEAFSFEREVLSYYWIDEDQKLAMAYFVPNTMTLLSISIAGNSLFKSVELSRSCSSQEPKT
jgi:hypothetical protein